MKFCGIILASIATCLGAVKVSDRLRSRSRANPVQQVVKLLSDLQAEVQKAAQDEEKAYSKFSEWCKGSKQDKGFEIETATNRIADLSAKIEKADADASSGTAEVAKLADALGTADKQLTEATAIREQEKTDRAKTMAELTEAIDMLNRAIETLERKAKGSAMLQANVDMQDMPKVLQAMNTVVEAAALSLNDKQRLMALAQSAASATSDDSSDDLDLGAPKAAAYASHTGNIVDVLEDMREKAEGQLAEARKDESNEAHNYNMLKQSVDDQMANDAKEKSNMAAVVTSATQAKAVAEGDLAETQQSLADAKKALATMTGSCTTTEADHAQSVKSRNAELEALANAKQAIVDATGGAENKVYDAASFVQLGAVSGSGLRTRADLTNFEVVTFVRKLAKEQHTPELAQLASRVASVMKRGSSRGVFAKVKGLINDLINRLETEASEEATEKSYCDKQTAESNTKIDELSAGVRKLSAKIESKVAAAAALKQDVTTLNSELAALAKSQASMDAIRKEQKAAFGEMKADLNQGLEGVRTAQNILRQYYGTGSAAFVQQPDAPVYHSKASGAGGGIIGMLDVIESDFAKSLAEGEDEEMSAASEYDKVTKQNAITKAVKDKDVVYKQKEAASLDKEVAELTSDRGTTEAELDAINKFKSSLDARCIAKPLSYEERKGRRETEIAGLRKALEILSDGVALLEQK